jgi:hypothetical protein
MDVHPDESISQVNFVMPDEAEIDEDIYGECASNSDAATSYSMHPAYFKITEENIVEGRHFLKVLTIAKLD